MPNSPFKNLTAEAAQAISLATDESRSVQREDSAPEHLFLALLRLRKGVAAETLRFNGLSLLDARAYFTPMLAEDRGSGGTLNGVVMKAMTQAIAEGCVPLTSGHLLLALCDAPYTAISQYLAERAIDLEEFKEDIRLNALVSSEFLDPATPTRVTELMRQQAREHRQLIHHLTLVQAPSEAPIQELVERLRTEFASACQQLVQRNLRASEEPEHDFLERFLFEVHRSRQGVAAVLERFGLRLPPADDYSHN